MKLYQAFLFSLALATRVIATSPTGEEVQLRQLTEDNFRASTSRGVWSVTSHFLSADELTCAGSSSTFLPNVS